MTSATNTISMDNRRKYAYNDISTTLQNTIGSFTGYPIQKVEVNPNDVLLVHISDDLSLKECHSIVSEMNETFPNNKVILCNHHVLKGLTILQGTTQKVSDVVDIKTNVDIDKLFDSIMKGHPNDFLY